jgi:3-oxoacyl-[acyl-carrier-protein] synthase II
VRPLAITGIGLVSPIGIGFADFRAALARPAVAEGEAFRSESSVLSPDKIPAPFAAEAWNFDATTFLGSKGLRNHDRLTLFLLVAAKQALEDAGLKQNGTHAVYGPERIGVCSATAYGSLDSINELVEISELQDPRFVNPNRFPNTVINSAAGYVSIWEDLRAPNVTVVDGNCGALDAVLTSETHLTNGRADAFLVGGGEVLSEPLYLAFRKLGTLAEAERRYKPGFPDGEGMRLGEGAVYLAVERMADAERRNARCYARVVGYGNTFEPPESEAALVHASKRSVARTIEMALSDANLPATAIDVVCGSVSGMPAFDRAELAGIENALGPDVAVAAPKTLYGETFGASGALGVASALAWFSGAPVGPMVHGKPPAQLRNVLVLAVGLYGNASAVILSA